MAINTSFPKVITTQTAFSQVPTARPTEQVEELGKSIEKIKNIAQSFSQDRTIPNQSEIEGLRKDVQNLKEQLAQVKSSTVENKTIFAIQVGALEESLEEVNENISAIERIKQSIQDVLPSRPQNGSVLTETKKRKLETDSGMTYFPANPPLSRKKRNPPKNPSKVTPTTSSNKPRKGATNQKTQTNQTMTRIPAAVPSQRKEDNTSATPLQVPLTLQGLLNQENQLIINSRRALVAFTVAEDYISVENYEAAIPHLEQAITANPKEWKAKALLASCYFKLKNYKEAASHYASMEKRAISEDLNLIACLIELQQYDEANSLHVKVCIKKSGATVQEKATLETLGKVLSIRAGNSRDEVVNGIGTSKDSEEALAIISRNPKNVVLPSFITVEYAAQLGSLSRGQPGPKS